MKDDGGAKNSNWLGSLLMDIDRLTKSLVMINWGWPLKQFNSSKPLGVQKLKKSDGC